VPDPKIEPMWPTGNVHKWQEMGGAAGPLGPAMATLRSVVAPLASTIRAAGVAYISVQVVIWHAFYLADPWRLTGPAAAAAWGTAAVVSLRRRWPSPSLAALDFVVYMTLALGAQGSVPPQVRDGMFGWLVISMSGQLLVPAWYAPGALAVLLTLVAPAGYWAGATLQPVTDRQTMTGAALVLLVVGLAHILARRELSHRARAADWEVAEAAQTASEQYAVLSRTIERREHERLLHDTILNTLTALARTCADDVAEVASRCRSDVALIENALSDRDDPAGPTRPTRPAGELAGDPAVAPAGDLPAQVRAVVAGLRGRGLAVHLEIEADGTPAVPARVCAAIANATREALSNVAAHAGTAQAWVQVRMVGDGGAAGWLQVTVRDEGSGFDPSRIDQDRLGLRRSIAERIGDCGGRASIRSAPGQGTEVSLIWPASADRAPAPADRAPAPEGRSW
jgi:signal transduction histidine kinase